MRPLEQVPAVRRIETDRADLCALDVVGHLTSADLENAFGLIEAAHVDHSAIDLLLRLSGYDGVAWDSVFPVSDLRGKGNALRKIRRCAIVGGPAWIPTGLGLFGPLGSMESRHFDAGDDASAWKWLDASPAGDGA